MFVIKRIPTILFVITRNNFFPNASILGNINLHKSPIFFNPVCYIPIKQDTNDQRRVKRIIKRTFHAVKILWKHCRWCSILCNEGIRLNFWYALREIELVGFVLTAWSEKEDVTSGSTSVFSRPWPQSNEGFLSVYLDHVPGISTRHCNTSNKISLVQVLLTPRFLVCW